MYASKNSDGYSKIAMGLWTGHCQDAGGKVFLWALINEYNGVCIWASYYSMMENNFKEEMMTALWLFGTTSNFLRDLVLVLCILFFLKIKVSVSSGGDCIRTYKPEIKKGSYNNIIVNVKTAVADNLLFYLGSAKFVSLTFNFSLAHCVCVQSG